MGRVIAIRRFEFRTEPAHWPSAPGAFLQIAGGRDAQSASRGRLCRKRAPREGFTACLWRDFASSDRSTLGRLNDEQRQFLRQPLQAHQVIHQLTQFCAIFHASEFNLVDIPNNECRHGRNAVLFVEEFVALVSGFYCKGVGYFVKPFFCYTVCNEKILDVLVIFEGFMFFMNALEYFRV